MYELNNALRIKHPYIPLYSKNINRIKNVEKSKNNPPMCQSLVNTTKLIKNNPPMNPPMQLLIYVKNLHLLN
jgi:hypothetical protein